MRKIKGNSSLLHSVSRSTLFCYRLIGLFPITGLGRASVDKLRLTFKSWYSVIIAFAVIVKIFELCGRFYSLTTTTLNIRSSVELLTYSLTLTRILFLLRIANVWPSILQTSLAIESNLHGLQINRQKVLKKCKTLLVIFITCGIVNMFLFTAFLFKASEICNNKGLPDFEAFMKFNLQGVFQLTAYRLWKGVIFSISFCQNAFLQDIFEIIIMQASIYLTCLFRAFNKRVKESVKIQTQKNFAWMLDKTEVQRVEWRTLRLEYTNICKLVDLVNRNMSGMILVAYGQNMLMVWYELLQLMRRGIFAGMPECDYREFRGIWTPYNYVRTSYHYTTLAILIARIGTTSWLAAGVEAASKRSEMHLYEVTEVAKSNFEAERLLSQIRSSTITLDGLGFFRITRSMILSVVGIIVTYEIMALQYTPEFSGNHKQYGSVVNKI